MGRSGEKVDAVAKKAVDPSGRRRQAPAGASAEPPPGGGEGDDEESSSGAPHPGASANNNNNKKKKSGVSQAPASFQDTDKKEALAAAATRTSQSPSKVSAAELRI